MSSKNIVAKGTTYNGVESVTFPVSGGGDATFYEVSDTTATASDVASGKYFYTSSGTKTQGTASSGGPYSLIYQDSVEASTTSTTAELAKTITFDIPKDNDNDWMICVIVDSEGERSGYFYCTVAEFVSRGTTLSKGGTTIIGNGRLDTSGSASVYANASSQLTGAAYKTIELKIYKRYSAAYGTTDGTYLIKIYVAKESDLL